MVVVVVVAVVGVSGLGGVQLFFSVTAAPPIL